MPYTTLVAGTTITASWANANVRDQVVTPFASSSARTSAITSPLDGMLTYLQDTDYFEGRINGAWQRILDYRAGKGIVYAKRRVTAATLITGVTTEATAFSKTVTGLEVGRSYLITCMADCYNETVNGTSVRLRVKDGTTAVADSGFVVLSNAGFPSMATATSIYDAAATSVTFNATLTLQGSGTAAITSGPGTPFLLIVADATGVSSVIEA